MPAAPNPEPAPHGADQGHAEPLERDFQNRAPPDRFCDLILTGGVTSAIAYPAVIFTLAQAYRFHGLGGSSSGAGTAALAAAAEYRRRRGSTDGFRTLLRGAMAVREDAVAGAPAMPSPKGDDAPSRHTKLSWLFQPDRDLQRLFEAVAPGIARGRVLWVLWGLLKAYAGPFLLAAGAATALLTVVFQALCGPTPLAAWLALACGVVVAGVHVVKHECGEDLRRFTASDFGLCTGQQALPDAPHPPLTAWLYDLMQEVAGRDPQDAPLTFADLHQVRGGPEDLLVQPPTAAGRSIDLRVYTANITQGRPVVFPQAELTPGAAPSAAESAVWAAQAEAQHDTLYFKPCELQPLFPAPVLAHLIAHSAPASEQPAAAAEQCWWVLPRAQLPVVVAARMSVSFPVLFRAVPLWLRPRCAPGHGALFHDTAGFERCLFADGSLCSSFPIHLFDSLLPAWPTFGVALVDRPDLSHYSAPTAEPDRVVHLPEASQSVGQARWFPPAPATEGLLARVGGFVGAMLGTVMHWHDKSLAEFPGARERVVQLGLPRDIGGLNIFMNRAQIEYLASLGLAGAKRLVERYALPDEPDGNARGWHQHRWLRLQQLMDGLHGSVAGVAAAERARHAPRLSDQLAEAHERHPLAQDGAAALSRAEAAALQARLAALAQFESTFGGLPLDSPRPAAHQPVLRVLPPT